MFSVVECNLTHANLVEFLRRRASKNIEKEVFNCHTSSRKLNIIGLLAVELFLTKDGKF